MMQVKMLNSLGSQIPISLRWTIGTIFLMTLASSSDPCPPAEKLLPCSCTDFPLYWSRTTETVTTTSTAELTSSPQTTSTTVPPTLPAAEKRKRRHVKRQVVFSPFSRDAYYTVVTCNGTSSVHDLEEAIGKGLRRRWVDKVIIRDHQPDPEDIHVRLPNELFKNTRLKQVEITNTLLAGDFIHYGNPFDGQAHSLMWFTARNCFLRGQLTYSTDGTVHTMGLNKLIRLEGLDMSGNELEYVSSSAFSSPPANLSTIKLTQNRIRALDYRAFQRLSKLRILDLSHNLLESVRRTSFPSNASRLVHINLSWNRLTAMPADFFTNMPALRVFNVSYNYMYSMPATPWANVWRQLQVIDFTGNYLLCDCSMKWLLRLLWPSEGNGTSTPNPLLRQTVFGSCSAFQQDSYPKHYVLANLTESSLDC